MEINYIGGDPRIVFVTRTEELCFDEAGTLLAIGEVEETSSETKINSFNEEQIEAFLRDNGIFPVRPSQEEL